MTYRTYTIYNNIDTRALQKLSESVLDSAERHKKDLRSKTDVNGVADFILSNETFRNRLIVCTKQSKQISKLAYELKYEKKASAEEVEAEINKLKATFTDSFGKLSNNISMECCIKFGLQTRRCYETDTEYDIGYIKRLERQGKTEQIKAYKAQVDKNLLDKLAKEKAEAAVQEKKDAKAKANDDFDKLKAGGKITLW